LAMPRLQPRIAREVVACAVAMVLCLQYLFVFLATRSPYADHYQYFVLLDMLFLSMTLRPSFRVYAIVAAIVFTLHSLAVHLFSQLQWQEGAMASLVLLVGTYITVMGCLGYDRRERRSYLFRLRETLRHAEADVASRRDNLTGFLNRGGLDKALEELWRGRHSQIAAIMIDVDHFKSYNDRYGHLAGDACVKKIAALIADASRQPHDILARFGGDEFLVLLPNTDLREGSRVAERMRRALQEAAIPHEGNTPGGCVTASFGVGSAITKTMHPRELIASADAALYCVKRNGRDGIWPQADRPVLSVVGPRPNEYERRLA
jgi:diguanylate cyclase (GGDEF)-like protein